jgi:hypothetical protein
VASHFKVIESEAEYRAALEAGLLYANGSISYPRNQSWVCGEARLGLVLGSMNWDDFASLSEDTKLQYCKEDLAVLVECDTD